MYLFPNRHTHKRCILVLWEHKLVHKFNVWQLLKYYWHKWQLCFWECTIIAHLWAYCNPWCNVLNFRFKSCHCDGNNLSCLITGFMLSSYFRVIVSRMSIAWSFKIFVWMAMLCIANLYCTLVLGLVLVRCWQYLVLWHVRVWYNTLELSRMQVSW